MDLSQYKHFVQTLLSEESKDFNAMISRLNELHQKHSHINWPALFTAADGLAAEGGEFMEIVKKIQWQGKEPTDEVRFHMKRELGDALFYLTTACIALGYSLDEIFLENISKLEKRYPGGKFEIHRSEFRSSYDI